MKKGLEEMVVSKIADTPYNLGWTGLAKSMNRTLMDNVGAMLKEVTIPRRF